jgi:spore germination protein YaaH
MRTKIPAAWATISVLAASANADSTLPGMAAHGTPSIHALEAATHAGGFAPATPVPEGLEAILPLQARLAAPFKEVHGFHPYWMGTGYTAYDWALLSTVSFFALELDASGAITNAHGWPWTGLVAAAHARGVRVTVTAQLFSPTALNTLLASTANRQNAIAQLVNAVTAGGADGVCIDFESVPGDRKADLVTFLGSLRSALQTAVPQSYLTIATPAVDWGNAFDYDQLALRCDHLVVMAYDYHWANSSNTGPVAPLGAWGPYNVAWTVQDYVTWGTPRGKILLGVPYYGYRWPASGDAAGAPATGTGASLTYTQAAAEAAVHGALWDAPSSTPWLRYQNPSWLQTWYDNDQSLDAKYAHVWTEGLAGISIWALGYDGARPELWTSLRESFGSRVADTAPRGASTGVALAPGGPNPFRGSTRVWASAGEPTPASVIVTDTGGRLVRHAWDGTLSAERQPILWDGRDGRGRPVPAGVYWIVVRAGSATRMLRVVRLGA